MPSVRICVRILFLHIFYPLPLTEPANWLHASDADPVDIFGPFFYCHITPIKLTLGFIHQFWRARNQVRPINEVVTPDKHCSFTCGQPRLIYGYCISERESTSLPPMEFLVAPEILTLDRVAVSSLAPCKSSNELALKLLENNTWEQRRQGIEGISNRNRDLHARSASLASELDHLR